MRLHQSGWSTANPNRKGIFACGWRTGTSPQRYTIVRQPQKSRRIEPWLPERRPFSRSRFRLLCQADYMLVLTLLKVVESLAPSVDIADTAATAIRAAMRPYSIAVAPLEFGNNFRIMVMAVPLQIAHQIGRQDCEPASHGNDARNLLTNCDSIWFPMSCPAQMAGAGYSIPDDENGKAVRNFWFATGNQLSQAQRHARGDIGFSRNRCDCPLCDLEMYLKLTATLALLTSPSFAAIAADNRSRDNCYDVVVLARPIEQIPSVAPQCGDCIIMRWPWFVDLQIKRVLAGTVDAKLLRVLTVQHTWLVRRDAKWLLRRNSLGGFNSVGRPENEPPLLCPAGAVPAAPYIQPGPGETLENLRKNGELRYGRAPK